MKNSMMAKDEYIINSTKDYNQDWETRTRQITIAWYLTEYAEPVAVVIGFFFSGIVADHNVI